MNKYWVQTKIHTGLSFKTEINENDAKDILSQQIEDLKSNGWDTLLETGHLELVKQVLSCEFEENENYKPPITKVQKSLTESLKDMVENIKNGSIGSALQLNFILKDTLIDCKRIQLMVEEKLLLEVLGHIRQQAISETLNQISVTINNIKKTQKIK